MCPTSTACRAHWARCTSSTTSRAASHCAGRPARRARWTSSTPSGTTSVASPLRCRRLRAAIGGQRKAQRAAHTERPRASASDAMPRCASMTRADRQMIGDATPNRNTPMTWNATVVLWAQYGASLLAGLATTLELAAIAIAGSLLLGTLVSLASLSRWRPIRAIAAAYVDFVRCVPLLVHAMFWYFGATELLPPEVK